MPRSAVGASLAEYPSPSSPPELKMNLPLIQPTSFDQRIVSYEEIHAIDPGDFLAFVTAAEIKGPCSVLDCGCGYGAVTREILLSTKLSRQLGGTQLAVDLIDESEVQLERAKRELQVWQHAPGVTLRFRIGAFPEDLSVPPRNYDVVACKMVLHEICRDRQLPFLQETYRVLRSGGRLVFWDVCLSDDMAPLYRAIVRKKDELAQYDTLVERRHFLTAGELRTLFNDSPFRGFHVTKNIVYRFNTRARLMPEFDGDETRLDQWHSFIRRAVTKANSLPRR